MADNDGKPSCLMCPAPGHLLCGQCKEVRFCSAECQESAWYSHRLLCKKILKHQKRPADGMYRVIYFPSSAPKSSKPEFRWMPLNQKRVGEHASLYELMDEQIASRTDVDRQHPFLARTHDQPLVITYDDNFLENYPGENNVNMALAQATAGYPSYFMAGPIVVHSGSTDGTRLPRDVNMMDYHHVCAWFINYYNLTDINLWRKGPKIPGVKIPCKGEYRLTGKPSEAVTVCRFHPVWKAGSLSPISQRIGLPLLAVPYRKTRPEWTLTNDRFNASTFTQLGIDPDSNHDFQTSELGNFGLAPKRWQHDRGNVLLVRQDGKAIDAETVEAFVDFCHWHLVQYFELNVARHTEVPSERLKEIQELAVKECTPENWATYLQDWKKYKQQGIKDDKEVNTRVDGKVSMGFDEETAGHLCNHLLRTRY